jgi:hypothetical protein
MMRLLARICAIATLRSQMAARVPHEVELLDGIPRNGIGVSLMMNVVTDGLG